LSTSLRKLIEERGFRQRIPLPWWERSQACLTGEGYLLNPKDKLLT